MTKKFTRGAEGELQKEAFPRPWQFGVMQLQLRGLKDLSYLLKMAESARHFCIVRGQLTSAALKTLALSSEEEVTLTVEGLRAHRTPPVTDKRIRRTKNATAEAPATLQDAPRSWVCLDIDDLELPEGLSLKDKSARSAALDFIIQQLPEPFHEASYHYQWSSSACMKSLTTVKIHLWFWLSHPFTSAELKSWVKRWPKEAQIIDQALCNEIQVHFTASPLFEGIKDPFAHEGDRSGFVERRLESVPVEELELAPLLEVSKSSRRVTGARELQNTGSGAGAEKSGEPTAHEDSNLWNSSPEELKVRFEFLSELFEGYEQQDLLGRYMLQTLCDELARKVKGQTPSRHEALFLNAIELGRLIPGSHLSFKLALDGLLEAAKACGYADSPATLKKAEDQIIKGLRGGLDRPFEGNDRTPRYFYESASDPVRFQHLIASLLQRQEVYQGADAQLCQLRGAPGSKSIYPVNERAFGGLLSSLRWVVYNEQQKSAKPYRIPSSELKLLYDPVAQLLPLLRGISRLPLMDEEGEVLRDAPGYCAAREVYYDPAPSFRVSRQSEGGFKSLEDSLSLTREVFSLEPLREVRVRCRQLCPAITTEGLFDEVGSTPEEADMALRSLLDLFHDFPFSLEKHRLLAVSALMTSILRKILPAAPIYVISANMRGTGKTKLMKVIASATLGERRAPIIPWRQQREEREKTLTSALLEEPEFLLIDNATGSIGWELLDAAVTNPDGEILLRPLGQKRAQRFRYQAFTVFTGNNIMLSSDMDRRVITIPLKSKVEHPELRPRSDFKYPDIEERAASSALDLWGAILSILWAYRKLPQEERARIEKGCRMKGSFEQWCDAVQRPLFWLAERAGWAPESCDIVKMSDREIQSETQDAKSQAFELFQALQGHFGRESWWESRQLLELLREQDQSASPPSPLALQLADNLGRRDRNSKAIGRYLQRFSNHICQGYQLEQRKSRRKSNEYRLRLIAT